MFNFERQRGAEGALLTNLSAADIHLKYLRPIKVPTVASYYPQITDTQKILSKECFLIHKNIYLCLKYRSLHRLPCDCEGLHYEERGRTLRPDCPEDRCGWAQCSCHCESHLSLTRIDYNPLAEALRILQHNRLLYNQNSVGRTRYTS